MFWRNNHADDSGAKLRDVVIEAKRECRRTRGRLGPSFWTSMRKRFKPDDSEITHDLPATTVVNKRLRKAFKIASATNTTRRSKAPLLTWLRSCTEMGSRDLLALSRYVLKMKLGANSEMLSIALQFMKAVVRTNAAAEAAHAAIIRQIAHVLDRALCLSLASWRRGVMSDDRWLQVWGPCAALIMDTDAATRIYAARGSWTSVAKDVSNLCAQTHLGSSLFAWAQPHCTAAKLKEHAEKLLADMDKEAHITAGMVSKWWADVRAEASTMQADEILSHKREAKLSYRMAKISIEVGTWEDELFLILSAFLKTRFVGSKISEVAFEKSLLQYRRADPGSVEDSVIFSYVQGRTYVNELLAKHSQRGTVIVDLMRREKQVHNSDIHDLQTKLPSTSVLFGKKMEIFNFKIAFQKNPEKKQDEVGMLE